MAEYLGGSKDGGMDGIFKGMPYQQQIPYFYEYSLFHLGYFLQDSVNHLFFKDKKTDFWEMVLHHFLTVTLYYGMIMQNFIRVGIVISWLHSVSDISTAITRFFVETEFKLATQVTFALCILQWIIFRNFFMPLISYNAYVSVIYPPELAQYQIAPDILKFFLLCLCVLHAYWLGVFAHMLYWGLKKGHTEDEHGVSINEKKMGKAIGQAKVGKQLTQLSHP